MKNHPQRTCVGCGKTQDKYKMIRITTQDDLLTLDYKKNLPGRGAYVCPREDCIASLSGKGMLNRSLREKIKLSSVEELRVSLLSFIKATSRNGEHKVHG